MKLKKKSVQNVAESDAKKGEYDYRYFELLTARQRVWYAKAFREGRERFAR